MNNIQWYPGHMTKTRRMMEENISLVDIVIELVDARIPYSSKNPDLDTLAKNKHRILLLNKCDLADERATDIWQEYFEKQGFRVICINALKGNGLGEVTETARSLMKEKIEKLKARGRINVPIRSMIVGIPNVGKSTLMKLLLKELDPTEGDIIINKVKTNELNRRQIPYLRRNLGVVFQDFRLLRDRNIYENIAFALRVTETPTKVIKKKVPAALSLVGLAQKYKSFPKELSGGEQQRVAIARAIVNEPAILLADEPTGNLDPTNSWEIMSLLKEANERGTTVLVVTHNQEIVNEMNERVITMKQGVIVSDEQKGGYIDED